MVNKDILKAKKEVESMTRQNNKMNKRRNKLAKRVRDEHHLIDTLNKIVVKLKKEITDTNRVKDALRDKNLTADRHREQLRIKHDALALESTQFYARC